MPAKDRYHDTIVLAQKRAGWTSINEQVVIIVEDRRLWIDIRASKESENLTVLIEVKGFESMPSPVEYLAGATGKYALYQAALDYLNIELPLQRLTGLRASPRSPHSGMHCLLTSLRR